MSRYDPPIYGLADFIGYVKKNQATMRSGSAGIGSTGYVDCALFNQAIGVKVQDIPDRGERPASLQDLIGGQYDYFMTLSPTAVPPIQSNLVKGIAVFRRERLPSLPSLPTAYEQGMKDFEASTWFAFFFPKGTPTLIVRKLHDATAAAMDTPSVQDALVATGTFRCHPNIARPPICKASSCPRSRKTACRCGPPACRLID